MLTNMSENHKASMTLLGNQHNNFRISRLDFLSGIDVELGN